MKWNDHSKDIPEGVHALLSPSSSHWINYTDEKLKVMYEKRKAVVMGTILHDYARRSIELRQRLPKSNKTLNRYVNDAIGFCMIPEKGLKYSENCFGKADAISFRHNLLRIHDLKTGSTKASMRQLRIYAALFCLEYGYDPYNLSFQLRIYQNDDVMIEDTEPSVIESYMNNIIRSDKIIEECKEEEEGYEGWLS